MTTSEPFSCEVVAYERRGDLAVLTIDNPPVNGIGLAAREALVRGLDRALTDAEVRAVVVRGAGGLFCGGADIRQFGTPAAATAPLTGDVVARFEAARKPVIAAIHGSALGAGLEIALGCHYRVVAPEATLGLPEVKLGLVPGAGGTQRLPRLVGLEQALDAIVSGASIPARRALEIGLVDRVAEGDVTEAAVALAAEVAGRDIHPTAAGRPTPSDPEGRIDAERRRLSARRHPDAAALAALDCLEDATRLPLEQGLASERKTFERLAASSESRAIRYLFLAERQAARVPGITDVVSPGRVEQVAIVGAGTMGGGIAMAFANAEIPVVLIEREQAALDRGLAAIGNNYRISAAKGRLDAQAVAARLARIRGSTDLAAAAAADLVIEAVFEEMAVKTELFGRLDAICKPGAILATNTSRLDVNVIAAATSRPESVIGLHFFSPANVMRLLEIVRPERVAPWVIATCVQVARTLGKTPVLVGVCEGFVGNRMLTAYWREAGFLLEEGASPAQVDGAMRDFGMAMGPFATADLAGLDINWATRKRLAPTRPAHLRYSRIADRICERGRFGQKTGAGYFRYEANGRTPIPDPVVDAIIADCSAEAGIARRAVSDDEIVQRTVLALVNEAGHILEEGIAQRASDIDVVYVAGYGFPAFRGGPMSYADGLGLTEVLATIEAWERTQGAHWRPSGLLRRLAAEGRTFING